MEVHTPGRTYLKHKITQPWSLPQSQTTQRHDVEVECRCSRAGLPRDHAHGADADEDRSIRKTYGSGATRICEMKPGRIPPC
jgi:hypothetical protein